MDRKSKKAARGAAFTQTKPGRPPGNVPLRKHAMRFEAVGYFLLTATRGMKKMQASETAAAILHEKTVCVLASGSPDGEYAMNGVGFIFNGGVDERIDALQNRGKLIRQVAPALIESATGDDRKWLEHSAVLLDVALMALGAGDIAKLKITLAMLENAGWRGQLRCLLTGQAGK